MPVQATTLEVCNVIGLVDKSGSMDTADAPGGGTRWNYAKEFFNSFVKEVSKFDEDGMEIVFFNSSQDIAKGITGQSFEEQWNQRGPSGGTKLAGPLKWALDLHFERKSSGETRSTLIVVLTDGEPSDKNEIAQLIIGASNKLDRDEELAILFLQVGRDTAATAFLAGLDDDLQGKGAKYDIVDAKNIEDVDKLTPHQLVEAAFND